MDIYTNIRVYIIYILIKAAPLNESSVKRVIVQNKHGVNILHQNLGSPLHQKQEITNTGRCLETTFYILTFYVLILH
jgi:hypothetical protein